MACLFFLQRLPFAAKRPKQGRGAVSSVACSPRSQLDSSKVTEVTIARKFEVEYLVRSCFQMLQQSGGGESQLGDVSPRRTRSKVGVIQAASAAFDTPRSMRKLADWIARAAARGAHLAVCTVIIRLIPALGKIINLSPVQCLFISESLTLV